MGHAALVTVVAVECEVGRPAMLMTILIRNRRPDITDESSETVSRAGRRRTWSLAVGILDRILAGIVPIDPYAKREDQLKTRPKRHRTDMFDHYR